MILSESGERLLKRVQETLDSEPESKRAGLHVVPETAREEDDWLYVAIAASSRNGLRAIDFVELLDKVEKSVREATHSKVLLVPAAG